MTSPSLAWAHPARPLRAVGRAAIFLGAAALWGVAPPIGPRRVIAQLHFIGVKSLSVVVATGFFSGMVLALQGYYSLRKFGALALLGPAVALGLIRELGPVLTALMMAARAGSAIAAELGIMRISEQIDAIEVMGLNPTRLLVTPRLAAGVIAAPLLTALFDVTGIASAWLIATALLGVSPGLFVSAMRNAVALSDVLGGLAKSLAFGALVTWVCSYKGFFARSGAAGVGRATTEAVVASSVIVLVSDWLFTSVMFS